MKKRNETIRMLVLSAMFAALCCVTTMLVQFPTVAGYTNIGEGMCLLRGYDPDRPRNLAKSVTVE